MIPGAVGDVRAMPAAVACSEALLLPAERLARFGNPYLGFRPSMAVPLPN